MYRIREVFYSEWLEYIQEFDQVNLLQFWQYGNAKERSSRLWKAVRFVIYDTEDKIISLVQLLVISIPLIGGLARINRGPILHSQFGYEGTYKISADVISTILKEAKNRHWWVVQIAPEIINTNSAVDKLKNMRFQKLNVPLSASGLISLLPSEDELLMRLKGKWRNCLRKGLRLGVGVNIKTGNSDELYVMLRAYDHMQRNKDFFGISSDLIVSLSKEKGEGWEFTLFLANKKGYDGVDSSLGMLVSIRHGDTSTYFIGVTNDEGRSLHVNYVLLWEAILYAKQKGCDWFDIGGLNAITPKGIAHFKSGMNSKQYELVGEWRRFTAL